MLTSSRNAHPDTPRQNVLRAIWTPLNQSNWHIKSTITTCLIYQDNRSRGHPWTAYWTERPKHESHGRSVIYKSIVKMFSCLCRALLSIVNQSEAMCPCLVDIRILFMPRTHFLVLYLHSLMGFWKVRIRAVDIWNCELHTEALLNS